MVNSIDLILQQKRAELQLLEAEMKAAMRWDGDLDYGYAALLYPVMGELKREIAYFEYLQGLADPEEGRDFLRCLQGFLMEEWQSLAIKIERPGYWPHVGPIIVIKKGKVKHWVMCSLVLSPELQYFIAPDASIDLLRLGWKVSRSGTVLHHKLRLKTSEERICFHGWLSRTLLGPLQHLWSNGSRHYYVLEK
jgi:hypothetical protein